MNRTSLSQGWHLLLDLVVGPPLNQVNTWYNLVTRKFRMRDLYLEFRALKDQPANFLPLKPRDYRSVFQVLSVRKLPDFWKTYAHFQDFGRTKSAFLQLAERWVIPPHLLAGPGVGAPPSETSENRNPRREALEVGIPERLKFRELLEGRPPLMVHLPESEVGILKPPDMQVFGITLRDQRYAIPANRYTWLNLGGMLKNREGRRKFYEATHAHYEDPRLTGALHQLLKTRWEFAQSQGYENWNHLCAIGLSCPYEQMPKYMEASMSVVQAEFRKSQICRQLSKIEEYDLDFWWDRLPGTPPDGVGKPDQTLAGQPLLDYLLSTAGRFYGLTLKVYPKNPVARFLDGLPPELNQILEVRRGPTLMGYIYLMEFQQTQGLAHAKILCRGHAFLKAPPLRNKWILPEIKVFMHELGHCLHFLSYPGDLHELNNLPLDVVETPSVLMESLVGHPQVLAPLLGAGQGQWGQTHVHEWAKRIQTAASVWALHQFNPQSWTQLVAQVRDFLPKFSLAGSLLPGFSPLAGDAALHLEAYSPTNGNPLAYLFCFHRACEVVHKVLGPRQNVSALPDGRPDLAQAFQKEFLGVRFQPFAEKSELPTLGKKGPEILANGSPRSIKHSF